MRRAYATLDGPDGPWQIHYRMVGEGPPIVLLHPSPLTGAFLAPQIETLAPHAHCIAWDTPGYGNSDPLPASWSASDLEPYVVALRLFMEAVAVEAPFIYGSATGAQIGIEFAKAFPDRCSGLLLENVAHFSDEEMTSITDGYFPDLSPRTDGAHLATAWEMAQRSMQVFPWHHKDHTRGHSNVHAVEDKQEEQPEPDTAPIDSNIVHRVALAFLKAGENYDRAYRCAFANERLERLVAVQKPVHIVVWDDGLLGAYTERIASADLPQNFTVHRASSGMQARMEKLRKAANDLLD
ncbi:MAG: alpha/beta hydrolase [Pseudomonadota bacterium]